MEKHHFRLPELGLSRPPINPNPENGTAYYQTITYNRDADRDCSASIVILQHSQFGFSFCFKKNYHGGNSLKYALHAQVLSDPLDRPLERWTPPRWCVLPSFGQEHFYELTEVSWDEEYKNRFEKTGLEKRELLEQLRGIKLDHNQSSLALS